MTDQTRNLNPTPTSKERAYHNSGEWISKATLAAIEARLEREKCDSCAAISVLIV